MSRTKKEIRLKIEEDKLFITSAITNELSNLAYLEYFNEWENNGGMQWFFGECVDLMNEVMFVEGSPYLRWLEHWKTTEDSRVQGFIEFTNENCFDWYHMREARKLFESRYKKDECAKAQVSERIGDLINLYDNATDRNEVLSMSVTYSNKRLEENKLAEVLQLLRGMDATDKTLLTIADRLNIKL